MMYAKLKIDSNDFYGLRSNLWEFIDLANGDTCPLGFVEFQIANEKPALKENEVMGYHFVLSNGVLKRTYIAVDEEESKERKWQFPRTFSKLKCVSALMREGVWEVVKKWMEDNGLYDLYIAAQDFSESNELFTSGKTRLQEMLGWPDSKVEGLLKDCVLR